MAFPNPINSLVVPFLFLITVPLAIFASITTMLAFSILMFRVLVVYLDLAVQVVPQYLLGRNRLPLGLSTAVDHPLATPPTPLSRGSSGASSPTTPHAPTPLSGVPRPTSSQPRSSRRGSTSTSARGPRRASSGGAASAGTITPGSDKGGGISMAASVGIERDFEGVGGWRLDDDDDSSDRWMHINSRLELPLEHHRSPRHHQRSQSGGGLLTMSTAVSSPVEAGGPWMRGSVLRKAVSAEAEDSSRGGRVVSPNSGRTRTSTSTPLQLTSLEGSSSYFTDFSAGLGKVAG